MANERKNPMSKYQGKHIITFTTYPHAYIRVIRPLLTPNAQSVMMVLLDEIFGWGRSEDYLIELSYAQIKQTTGIKNDTTISRCLTELKDSYLIKIIGDQTTGITNKYQIRMDMLRWINDSLMDNKNDYEKAKEVYQKTVRQLQEREDPDLYKNQRGTSTENVEHLSKKCRATSTEIREVTEDKPLSDQAEAGEEINDQINNKENKQTNDQTDNINRQKNIDRLNQLLSGLNKLQSNKEGKESKQASTEQEDQWLLSVSTHHDPPTKQEKEIALQQWIDICGNEIDPSSRIFRIWHKRGYSNLIEYITIRETLK